MLGRAEVSSFLPRQKFCLTLVSEKMEPCLWEDWQGAVDESGDRPSLVFPLPYSMPASQ